MAEGISDAARHWLQQQQNGSIAFIVLATTFVGLKLLALKLRLHGRGGLGSEWELGEVGCVITGIVAFCLLCGCAIGKVFAVDAARLWLLTYSSVNVKAFFAAYDSTDSAEQLEHVTDIFKSSYAFSVIYPIASMMPKLCLCFMYQRIFMVNPVVRHITYGLIVF